jgi:ankyrin repeat protein
MQRIFVIWNMELLKAIQDGNIKRIKELLAKGEDPNFRTYYGNTPLIYASCLKIIQILLKAGADVSLKNYIGYSVLTYAIINQYNKIIKLLSSVIILVPLLHKLSKNKLPYNILRECKEYL